MVERLYDLHPEILEKICYIRNYIINTKLNKDKYPILFHRQNSNVKILLNTSESPDKAMGMFLLLPRDWVKMNIRKDNHLWTLIYCGDDRIIQSTIEQNINEFQLMHPDENRRRLQEKFEYFSYKQLLNIYPSNIICKTPCDCTDISYDMNDFDFAINCEFGIEVKSDRFWHTGNISLELLRDYRDEKIGNCIQNISNIGSILKTRADVWQEYYYCDRKENNIEKYIFTTEIYEVAKLQNLTLQFINEIYENIKPRNSINEFF